MKTPNQKKLKQAALPFKPLVKTPKSVVQQTGKAAASATATGKRKLSYAAGDEQLPNESHDSPTTSKAPKKAKLETIELTSSADEDEHEQRQQTPVSVVSDIVSNASSALTAGTIKSVGDEAPSTEIATPTSTLSNRRSARQCVASSPAATSTSATASPKVLTPKQLKLQEERRLAREEKERKLEELREQKQREKAEREAQRAAKEELRRKEREDKEELRRKEREDKEELRRKEREEKEEVRRKEREEKERLMGEKNEEKRKRLAVKEEEQRKKDEAQRRSAAFFSKFLVPKQSKDGAVDEDESGRQTSASNNDTQFLPFELKDAMTLAPVSRRNVLDSEARNTLDGLASDQKQDLPITALYLGELRAKNITPQRWQRPATTMVDDSDDDDDVQIVEDDLEVAGEVIAEDCKPAVERLRAKYFKFTENRRPPYRGTWRKQSTLISGRRPFAKDAQNLDYEVDSDLDWEEEEPGEVLGDSDDDDKDKEKEKESDDDDYEVDNAWLVPHGHLSDEERHCDDEDDSDGGGGAGYDDNTTREAQQVKLKVQQQEFALEMQKPTRKVQPRLIGVVFANDEAGEKINSIREVLVKRLIWRRGPPIKVQPEAPANTNDVASTTTLVEQVQPLRLTKELLVQLIRLLHMNRNSKDFLVNEFLAYLSQRHAEELQAGKATLPTKISLRRQIEEFAIWSAVDVQAKSDTSGGSKKKSKKVCCWLVFEAILEQFELNSKEQQLPAVNSWSYILEPKVTASAEDGATKKRRQPLSEPPKRNSLIKGFLHNSNNSKLDPAPAPARSMETADVHVSVADKADDVIILN